MKVYIQVIDTKTGVYQTGMIDEPVIEGSEIANTLKHFGVIYGEVNWEQSQYVSNYKTIQGNIEGTTKIISAVCV